MRRLWFKTLKEINWKLLRVTNWFPVIHIQDFIVTKQLFRDNKVLNGGNGRNNNVLNIRLTSKVRSWSRSEPRPEPFFRRAQQCCCEPRYGNISLTVAVRSGRITCCAPKFTAKSCYCSNRFRQICRFQQILIWFTLVTGRARFRGKSWLCYMMHAIQVVGQKAANE